MERTARAIAILGAGAVLLAGCSTAPPDLITPDAEAGTLASAPARSPLPWLPHYPAPIAPADPPASLQASGPADEVAEAELNEMAATMTLSLNSGSAADWLALFDEDAAGALTHDTTDIDDDDVNDSADSADTDDSDQPSMDSVGDQQAWFSTVQTVPMDVREMHFTRMVDSGVENGAAFAVAEFGFRHQITGADRAPAVQYYTFRVSRDDDGFLQVADVSGTQGLNASYPQVWDLGPAEVFVEDSLVAIVPRSSLVMAEEVMGELALAGTEVLGDFPVEGVDKIVVNLVESADLMNLLGTVDATGYAGFATYIPNAPDIEDEGAEAVTRMLHGEERNVRVALDLPYTRDEIDMFRGAGGGSALMRHEGLHVVMMLRTQIMGVPLWISEGFAGWYETIGDPEITDDQFWRYRRIAADDLPTELPPGNPLAFHGSEVQRNYVESAMVFHFVEDQWGDDLTYQLGIDLHHIRADGLDPTEVLQNSLDLTLEEFEAEFIDWATEQVS